MTKGHGSSDDDLAASNATRADPKSDPRTVEIARLREALKEFGQHKPECPAIVSFAFRCSGCGYITASRAEDHRASKACKGYCLDDKCPSAWPCPQCARLHYWGGYQALRRECTCGLEAALSPIQEPSK